jgi:hypothetical protein
MEENLRFIKIIYLETVHFNNKLIHLRNKISVETLTTDRMIPAGRIVHQQKLQIQNKTNPVDFFDFFLILSSPPVKITKMC